MEIRMLKKHRLIITYMFSHFTVDFACAFLLFRLLYDDSQWYLCLLIYNFCAFAMQMPIGLLADKWNRNAVCAAIGCGLIAVSFGLSYIPVLTVIIAGIGNSLFHVGGGIDVLNVSRKNPTLLGIFVSPGALGIFLGTILGKQGDFPVLVVVAVMVFVAATILIACYTESNSFQSNNEPVSFPVKIPYSTLIAIFCLLAVVCLRSYIGMILNFPWKEIKGLSYVLILAVVFGKASGGFLSARLGAKKTAILSLGLASVLFLFSNIPIIGIASVFFFNMSMPITLWVVANILPASKGFAFGLLTFGLFIGFVPAYLGYRAIFTTVTGFAISAVISLILLLIGLRKAVPR